MGSGKTTLGKKIARRLALPFVDVDCEIENRTGLRVSEIFDDFGENHFRALERNFIQNIEPDFHGVLSVGGGLPCFHNNMAILLGLGQVFYLQRSAKELANRLKNGKQQRPLIAELSDTELLEFISQKLSEREKFYSQAHWIPERTEQTADWIIERF